MDFRSFCKKEKLSAFIDKLNMPFPLGHCDKVEYKVAFLQEKRARRARGARTSKAEISNQPTETKVVLELFTHLIWGLCIPSLMIRPRKFDLFTQYLLFLPTKILHIPHRK